MNNSSLEHFYRQFTNKVNRQKVISLQRTKWSRQNNIFHQRWHHFACVIFKINTSGWYWTIDTNTCTFLAHSSDTDKCSVCTKGTFLLEELYLLEIQERTKVAVLICRNDMVKIALQPQWGLKILHYWE